MTYEHTSTDTYSPETDAPSDQTFEQYIEERFKNPRKRLLDQFEEAKARGDDTSEINNQIIALDSEYYALGGMQYDEASEALQRYREGSKDWNRAKTALDEAEYALYDNITAQDSPATIEPEVTPEQPAPESTPAEPQPETTSPSSPPETPTTPEVSNTEKPKRKLEIAVGEKVWYADKPNDGESRNWGDTQWEIAKVLPPKDDKPEVLKLVRGDEFKFVRTGTAISINNQYFKEHSTSTSAPASPQTTDTPQPRKESTPRSRASAGVAKTENGIFVAGSVAEKPKKNITPKDEFRAVVEYTLADQVKNGHLTPSEAQDRKKAAWKITDGFSDSPREDALHFAKAKNLNEALLLHDKPFADQDINEWYSSVMSNASLTPEEKEETLRMGPPSQEKPEWLKDKPMDLRASPDAVRQQLLAEGIDPDTILGGSAVASVDYDSQQDNSLEAYSDEGWDVWYKGIVNNTTLSSEQKRQELARGPEFKSDAQKLRELMGAPIGAKDKRSRKIGRQIIPVAVGSSLKQTAGSGWNETKKQASQDKEWLKKHASKLETPKAVKRVMHLGHRAVGMFSGWTSSPELSDVDGNAYKMEPTWSESFLGQILGASKEKNSEKEKAKAKRKNERDLKKLRRAFR